MPNDQDDSQSYQQISAGAMTYPAPWTFNRFIFKLPLFLWRTGLGVFFWRSMLILTTYGRKSGIPRHTMLSYFRLGDVHYVISGWGPRGDWYKNIESHPIVTIQAGRQACTARARRVEDSEELARGMRVLLDGGGDSHFEPWLESLAIQPKLEDMLAKRDRIYLVALDPVDLVGPPPLDVDLLLVWPLVSIIGLGIWLIRRR
jgi:deazaflavin-dependent oxidoreductase (nitroreductase family)